MRYRHCPSVLVCILGAAQSQLLACSGDSSHALSSGGSAGAGAGAAAAGPGSGGASGTAGDVAGGAAGNGASGSGGSGGISGAPGGSDFNFNQCGVAAPVPANPGQCKRVTAPLIANFDDYAGGDAASYTYYVNARPPAAEAVLGAVQHIDDGSNQNGGTSVISTEMVPGRDGAGYALEISDTNATNWGGLLSLYLPGAGAGPGCLDATGYDGIEFWTKGSSPSGNFGVSLNMLDTLPTSSGGSCASASASDCQSATLQFALPADPESWIQVRVPWNAMTPGLGAERACVPVTGQNLAQLVIQPFMNYPPPNFTFEPGPYRISVDDIGFYADPSAKPGPLTGGSATCQIPPSLHWSASAPVISPVSDASHDLVAVKDPSVVYFNNRWHVYASSVSAAGAYSLVYTSFTDFDQASSAPMYYLDQTPGLNGYTAAPELFYFTPQNKWYLVYQSGPPMYSTADDPSDPTRWTPPTAFFRTTPQSVTQNGGNWLDFWVICDAASCHLFFSDDHGGWYSSKTALANFPNGLSEPVLVMRDANAGRMFEASNVYKLNGTGQYLALIESFDRTSNNHRYFRSWLANSLDGPWFPWQASGSYPFAGPSNASFSGTPWTLDISHGEMIRAGYDETLAVDPCNMRYLFQGADPTANNGGDYNKIPWRLGLLTQAP